MIALLPGATSDLVPEDLYRLNRYTLTELNRESAEDLIRAVFNAPRYVAQPVGPRPTFDGALPSPAPATPSVTALRHATTPFEATGSAEYFERLSSVSDERSRHRRRGAGLTDRQVQSTLSFRAQVPQALHFGSGELRIVHGPLGSGKSDLAEEWHRSSLRRAMADGGAAVPVWITIDGLGTAALEPFVLAEVGLSALSDRGVDVVVDGLDERADRASSLMRQAGEFVKKWPRSRVLLTTRSPGLAPDELLVAAPLLTHQEAEGLMERVAGRQIPALGAQLQTAVLRPLFALLVAQRIAAVEGATGIHEVIDRVVDDVVSRENYDLFAELRALAVETIRGGGAIDPATIAAADVAARIRALHWLPPRAGNALSRWRRSSNGSRPMQFSMASSAWMRSCPRWTLSTGGATCSRSLPPPVTPPAPIRCWQPWRVGIRVRLHGLLTRWSPVGSAEPYLTLDRATGRRLDSVLGLRCSPGSTVLVRLPVALLPYAVSLRPLTISLSQFASMRHA